MCEIIPEHITNTIIIVGDNTITLFIADRILLVVASLIVQFNDAMTVTFTFFLTE